MEDLKELGPQLKTIRFAIPEELEPVNGNFDDEANGGLLLDRIEEVVRCRFERRRPLSAVERMVVGGSERSNRQQDSNWTYFYNTRQLGQYLQPL